MANQIDGRTDLKRGTRVTFKPFRIAGRLWGSGVVVSRDLDPNRKPGIGRVSYVVEFHPAFAPVTLAAKKLEVEVRS